MRPAITATSLALAISLLLLGACGQTGPLYMPKGDAKTAEGQIDAEAPEPTAVNPADIETQ